jgi:hypothetical protein
MLRRLDVEGELPLGDREVDSHVVHSDYSRSLSATTE